ncbi:LacI family DNA-binding transcriptional regulator [Labedella endophytica]|uniref:LacI family transcriptional regulator n=1 Tax=Labedella endophytica TaxID=1523160 RepID=A0A3S1CU44_9MICO|nr:LacI family DNA-binding transcriptional regulator [Labedella endophytica]RUR03152.1 LacI family transcriptional regulator [Labedella endophytica]
MSDDGAKRRVGVRDVALHAGVSTQTVSRVLNDYPGIRDDTRQRVLAAVADLDYRMNNAARALGTSRTRTVGVVASDTALYGPSAGIAALEAASRERGRWIATAYANADDEPSFEAAVRHLLAQGVDGIVLVAPHAGTRAALDDAGVGVPVVSLHEETGGRQAEGAGLAVTHLVEQGHRRLAEVAGPSDWFEATARTAGIEDAVARAGVDRADVTVADVDRVGVARVGVARAGVARADVTVADITGDATGADLAGADAARADVTPADVTLTDRWRGDWTAASGHALAAEVAARLAEGSAPTAIVVANDQMALGLIAGLTARGVDVPGSVSITGFDDNPDAPFYTPALTTVRVDVAGEARRAVADVLGESAPSPSPPRLVVRASTAPPAP